MKIHKIHIIIFILILFMSIIGIKIIIEMKSLNNSLKENKKSIIELKDKQTKINEGLFQVQTDLYLNPHPVSNPVE